MYDCSLAESCTGGLLSSSLTSIPGASSVTLIAAFITYSNESKIKMLNVDSQRQLNSLALSVKELPMKWLVGAGQHSQSDLAISVTGIAGPIRRHSRKTGRNGMLWIFMLRGKC